VEIDNLTKLVEQNSVMVVGHGDSIQEIMRQKQELMKAEFKIIYRNREDLSKIVIFGYKF